MIATKTGDYEIGFTLYVDAYEVSCHWNDRVRLQSLTLGYGQSISVKDFRRLIKENLIYFCSKKGDKL
ncbi:MAG TPA: hypothetical protein PKL44_00435 [Candidatus Dojkabacteria bacterium]|nr:hypothetical protein [Candidatus Dojkabacteria bacterium]